MYLSSHCLKTDSSNIVIITCSCTIGLLYLVLIVHDIEVVPSERNFPFGCCTCLVMRKGHINHAESLTTNIAISDTLIQAFEYLKKYVPILDIFSSSNAPFS